VDAGLADLKITTSFRSAQSEQFIAGLPAAYPVSVRSLPDRTVIEVKKTLASDPQSRTP
jgi:ferric-dicitrate binding protein FerR (iron transport regulator)